MHYYSSLPGGTETLKPWTIYDLVDDWILRSSMKPGRQILIYLSLIAVAAGSMIWITNNLTSFPGTGIGPFIVINVLLLFATIAVHEICHACVIIYYGGKPRFGAKWLKGLGPVVYVTTDGYFSVHAYRRIAAAPLMYITIICVLGVFSGAGWWLIVPFVFNAIGAGGDLLSLRILQRYRSDYLIKDTQDGFIAYKNVSNETVRA